MILFGGGGGGSCCGGGAVRGVEMEGELFFGAKVV